VWIKVGGSRPGIAISAHGGRPSPRQTREHPLFHDAGEFVALEEQDRTRWDPAAIAEGPPPLDLGLRRRQAGPYQLQAAIAACHAVAPGPQLTDWPEIAPLYGRPHRMLPAPVVGLNRAVAVAVATGRRRVCGCSMTWTARELCRIY
jgi:RNA polymerase sigma-70 factor, ECF subfamily